MKKKLLVMLMSLALVATTGVGATLAYLTDSDVATNVFTVGKIDIEIEENFEQNSLLLPVVYDKNGTLHGGVKKEVFVKSAEDSNDAFVRVFIAIPNVLDDGDSTFNAAILPLKTIRNIKTPSL